MEHLAIAGGRREVEAFVQEAAAGERRPDEVPRQPEERGPVLGVDAIGAVHHLVDERPEFRVVELASGGRGEEVVTADERDDLGHTRHPLGEQRTHGIERPAVGKPVPVALALPAVLDRQLETRSW